MIKYLSQLVHEFIIPFNVLDKTYSLEIFYQTVWIFLHKYEISFNHMLHKLIKRDFKAVKLSVAMVGVQEAQAYKTCGKSRRIIVICICTCICSWTPLAGLLYDFLLRSPSGFRSPKISVFHVGTSPLTSLPACRIATASFITLGHQP